MKALAVFAATLTAACARPAHGPDTWLVSRFHQEGAPGSVGFALTIGTSFPAHDFAVRPDRIEASGMRLAGVTRPLGGAARGEHALLLSAAAPGRGIAAAYVVLKARDNSRRIAKTFFNVGNAVPEPSWQEPLGLPLEIVPGTDPTGLHSGDRFSLVVLADGKASPDLSVRATSASGTHFFATTDAAGRAAFTLGQAGAWLFAGSNLRRSGDHWESDFTTLTVEVRATAPAEK